MGNPRPGWGGKFPAKVLAEANGVVVLEGDPKDTGYLSTWTGKTVTVDIELPPAVPPDGDRGLGDQPGEAATSTGPVPSK